MSERSLFQRSLVSRTEGLTRLAGLMLAIALAVTIAPLSRDEAEAVRQMMVVGIVVLIGWFLLAGAASLVVGLALQPMLKNLIAGVQLAMIQPIRIDDALLIEANSAM